MTPRIPGAVKAEHDELHHEIEQAKEAEGETGRAARKLAVLLEPHIAREEDYALPPLSALLPLAQGMQPAEPELVVSMASRLEATLTVMFAEHRVIIDAARALADAAKAEKHDELSGLASRIILHTRMEEEILYPAAILAGRLLRMK